MPVFQYIHSNITCLKICLYSVFNTQLFFCFCFFNGSWDCELSMYANTGGGLKLLCFPRSCSYECVCFAWLAKPAPSTAIVTAPVSVCLMHTQLFPWGKKVMKYSNSNAVILNLVLNNLNLTYKSKLLVVIFYNLQCDSQQPSFPNIPSPKPSSH